MGDLHIALVHYPVLDRNGRIITSAITSLDIHDIARSACTYGARAFFVVHPVAGQREFAARVIRHWFENPARQFDSRRQEALELVHVVDTLDCALAHAEKLSGRTPVLVTTSARPGGRASFADMRETVASPDGPPHVIAFGTGFGLAEAVIERSDLALEPVYGTGSYNHLSVRAAAGIILDRLRGS
jgi:hypothetical protein